jgi:hypothetical protein
MANIVLGINTLTDVCQPVYANHMQFIFDLGRRSDHKIALFTPSRMSIDRMRNGAAKFAVDQDFDYLCFVDDDVIVPPGSITQLIEADQDIVAAWTIIRGHPFENMFFDKHPDNNGSLVNVKTADLDMTQLVRPVAAVGFSYVLIKVSHLKKVNPPYFITGAYNTEDIYFCMKSKMQVPDVKIAVHLGVETMHKVGYEFVGPGNQQSYRDYIEKVYPEMIIPPGQINKIDPRDSNAEEKEELGKSREEVIYDDVWNGR